MLVSAALLGLAGVAAASPLNVVPNYPPHKLSTGFRLAVNVTDKSRDFKPSIQGLYLNSIHVGAGLNQVGIGAKDISNIFYQNGTAAEYRFGASTTITDEATPLTPFGLSLYKDGSSKTLSTAAINGGAGTPGVAISQFPEPYLFLLPETYVICNESLAYYQGTHFLVVEQAATTVSEAGQIEKNIPEGCAPVRLLPECAKLEDLPEGSYASHEFALNSQCYEDVSSINWSLYGP
ncbi:hypothetical protein TARUN_5463 [Trichoderma arundinaceum]|uniref:DUF7907 domain-containing protein n=1 Tax=Trichoderma arundinaceum TaxID=490622 RepID=A0A395NL31_TRIAR|nr:hypothetical protein TARUN_5463 [Trichoderma arundinaceum]